MKTSIIILTYNKLNYTQECIESIRRYTEPGSYEIIVVDNQSSDGTVDWLSQQNDIKCILNSSNLGFPKGCNQGIEIATGENILLLNNDTVVTTNWLNNLVACLYSDSNIGAVSCVTNNCSYMQAIHVPYAEIQEMHQFAESFNVLNPALWEERLKLVGFCMLIKRSVVDRIGLLDEQFTPGNYEDDDYSLRIRKEGYKLILCKDTFIHHYGSVSFKETNNSYIELLHRNAKKFEEKWGFNPDYSQHIRTEIVDLIDFEEDRELHVLEVGCACGGTLLKIKDRYKQSKLYGIELNEYSAGVASLIAEVSATNVEQERLNYPESYFDVIIFADVLEHLYDPWKVLKQIKKHMKPDGLMLISLPNILHKSVVHSYLNGFWTYQDSGIMDRTHTRFFTLHEINKMMLEAGYTETVIKGKSMPSGYDQDSFVQQISSILPEHVREQLNVYQFIVRAKNNTLLMETLRYVQGNEDNRDSVICDLSKYSNEEVIQGVKALPSSDQVNVFNRIGVYHFEQGVYKRVLPYFEAALSYDEEDTESLFNVIYFLHYLGETEVALKFEDRLKIINKFIYQEVMNAVSTILK